MRELEFKKYHILNDLAEKNGIVVLGSGADKQIPIGELRQAFEINEKIYNRSFENLSLKEAELVYDQCVSELEPETILVHIGESDLEFFKENPAKFDALYCGFLKKMKADNKKCHIVVVSLKNYENNSVMTELNRHLQFIAESERCEYADISGKRLWNPKSTKEAVAFVYSLGFVRPLKNKRPTYDLIKVLFYTI